MSSSERHPRFGVHRFQPPPPLQPVLERAAPGLNDDIGSASPLHFMPPLDGHRKGVSEGRRTSQDGLTPSPPLAGGGRIGRSESSLHAGSASPTGTTFSQGARFGSQSPCAADGNASPLTGRDRRSAASSLARISKETRDGRSPSPLQSLVHEMDPSTDRLVATYRCGELLGQGGFAKVFDFVNINTNERFACKMIAKEKLKDSSTRAKFFAEIEIHRDLKHPNILNFVRFFEDPQHYYILLERCCRQSLMDLHQERIVFSDDEIRHIMAQLISATSFLHSQLIIHRDLKLGNIMIDPYGNVKLGDFGFSTRLQSADERKKTMCGTPNYIAPEVLRANRPNSPGYSFEVDIWSLGVVLYTLAVGKPPFETSDVPTTYERIKRCEYAFPPRTLSKPSRPIALPLQMMVGEMLRLRPEERSPLSSLRHHMFMHKIPRNPPPSLVDLDAEISPRCSPCDSRKDMFPNTEQDDPQPSQKSTSNFVKDTQFSHPTSNELPQKGSSIATEQEVGILLKAILDLTHFPKYGWCYHSAVGSRRFLGICLNDRTKILLDEKTHQLWYFNRERKAQRNVDEPYCFPTLDDATLFAESSSGIAMALPKKISILKFLMNYCQRLRSTTGSSGLLKTAYCNATFANDSSGFSSSLVYVKEVVEQETTLIPSGWLATLVSIRMSDGGVQHSLSVTRGVPGDHVGIGSEECETPWSVDFAWVTEATTPTVRIAVADARQRSAMETIHVRDVTGISEFVGSICLRPWICRLIQKFL